MVDLRNTEAAFLQLRIRQNVPSPSAASVRVARLGVADLFQKLLIIVTLFRKLLIIVTGFIMGMNRNSIPKIIDHRYRLYYGNERRAPRKDAISIFASGRRNNSSPTKLPRETRPQEDECDFETALFGAYYRVSIRDAEAEGCPCDCPYYPQRVGQLSQPINRATRFCVVSCTGRRPPNRSASRALAAYGHNCRHKP
jgi:hypothetical protein